ncbi:MAG: Mu transposase C-terminal domain-containing protein [Clostridia bacterium]|nr:Mu transposase C-terminal domain-containing protein [Clostridia bacterium]
MDLQTLVDAFLVDDTRKVDKTGVFRLNGVDYQAPLELARTRISIRYDPFDMAIVQVFNDGKRYEDAYPLEIPEHINHAVTEEKVDDPKPTGLNYLKLLKEKDQEGISYRGGGPDVP